MAAEHWNGSIGGERSSAKDLCAVVQTIQFGGAELHCQGPKLEGRNGEVPKLTAARERAGNLDTGPHALGRLAIHIADEAKNVIADEAGRGIPESESPRTTVGCKKSGGA